MAIVGPHPTTVLLRLSVTLSAVAGFGLGIVLLGSVALGRAASLPFTALAQVHGQVQTIGFVGLFILGTAAQLLPSFLVVRLRARERLIFGGYLIAAALVARVVAQPAPVEPGVPGTARAAILWLAALGEVAGVALCLSSFLDLARRSVQPPDLWRTLVGIGFGGLIGSLALNLVATASLASGRSVVPAPLDAALVQLELWGFAAFVAFGIARKVLPRFLLLPAPRDRYLAVAAAFYLAGVLLGVAADLAGIAPTAALAAFFKLAGVVAFLGALRLFARPVRASGAPGVTEPARRWLRIAFGWLAIAAALDLAGALVALATASLVPYFELGAARHAFGQGFILTLLVTLGARILPGFSGWAIQHPRTIEGLVAAIGLGALLRVGGELGVALGMPAAALVDALGGAIGVAAFLVFAVVLARAVGKIPSR